MSANQSHRILEVRFKPAEVVVIDGEEFRGLDGYQAVCSCGYRMGHSLGERWAAKLGAEHVAYMRRRESR